MAGAEIFERAELAVRYAYVDGLSIHPDQLTVIRRRLGDEKRRDFFRHTSNLQEIKSLKDSIDAGRMSLNRYDHLSPTRHVILREIYETMLAELAQEG